jgi:aspartate racemase
MKTIGLVGGTSWVSTVDYYKLINEETNKRFGDLNFAKCILYSFDYNEIYQLNEKEDYNSICELMIDASNKLISIGADCILLCANTLHMYADKIKAKIDVPLIHIAEATSFKITEAQLKKVLLLGTKYTMGIRFL